MSSDWEMYVKRTGMCSQCAKPFVEEEIYNASLFSADEGFQRKDFCKECWNDDVKSNSFSHWQAKVPKKEEKKKLFVDDQVLIDFFKRLIETDDPSKAGFTFVLALILMRKRLLKYISTETHENGTEIWVMKLIRDEKEYKVPNPHLDDQNIEMIRTELNNVLAGE
jgi:hypothetical protein